MLPSLRSHEVFQSGSERGSSPMPCSRAIPLLRTQAPAATENGPAERRGAPDAGDAADHAAPTPAARLRHDAPEEQHGLRALAEHRGEGDEPHDPESIGGARLVDPVLHLAPDEPSVLPHPPRVPREQGHGGEDDGDGDEVGPDVKERPGQVAHGDPHAHARQETQDSAAGEVADAVASADLLEVGVDDAQDQGGLEGLAQRNDEGGAHGYSATMVALAVSEWYSPTKGYLPGLRAGILSRTVLPAGMTFSMRGVSMSSSSGPLSLFVITRTKGTPALTLMTSGCQRLFSSTRGSSGSAATAAPTNPTAMTRSATNATYPFIATPLLVKWG